MKQLPIQQLLPISNSSPFQLSSLAYSPLFFYIAFGMNGMSEERSWAELNSAHLSILFLSLKSDRKSGLHASAVYLSHSIQFLLVFCWILVAPAMLLLNSTWHGKLAQFYFYIFNTEWTLTQVKWSQVGSALVLIFLSGSSIPSFIKSNRHPHQHQCYCNILKQ